MKKGLTLRKEIAAKEQELKQEIAAKELELEQNRLEAERVEQEEKANIETTKQTISKLCTEQNYFCGVIITTDDLLMLVKLSIENKGENISIPFNIYNV